MGKTLTEEGRRQGRGRKAWKVAVVVNEVWGGSFFIVPGANFSSYSSVGEWRLVVAATETGKCNGC